MSAGTCIPVLAVAVVLAGAGWLAARRGRRFRRPAFAAVVLALALGVGELAAGTAFRALLAQAEAPPPPAADGTPVMKGNPYLLWELAPGRQMQGGVVVSINSHGMRGPEPAMPKPAGTRRILSTGDSSVFGFQVEDDQVMIQVAARVLGVEGLNAAIPGYSTYQSINMLEMRALALQPDVLVIANLWSDNNFDSFVDTDLLEAYSSFEGGCSGSARRGLRCSALFRLLRWEVFTLQGSRAEARKVGWSLGQGQQAGRRRVPVDEYAANLQRMVDLARSAGAEVCFVVLPNQEDLVKREGPPAWDLYRAVMRDVARRNGAPVLEGPDVVRASGKTRGELFKDEMHPSAEGHRLLGEALAAMLQGWAAGSPLMGAPADLPLGPYEDTWLFQPDHGPNHDAQPRTGKVHITGVVVHPAFTGRALQVDAMVAGSSAPVGHVRLDAPGPFTLDLDKAIPDARIIVYEDMTGDGPTADDKRTEIQGVSLSEDASGVTIDVAARTYSGG